MLLRSSAAVRSIAATAASSSSAASSSFSSSSFLSSSTSVACVAPLLRCTSARHLTTSSSSSPLLQQQQQQQPQQSILHERSYSPLPTPRPVSTRVFTKSTLRRQALKQTQPWFMNAATFRQVKLGGFGRPVQTKLPEHLRQNRPEYEMRKLRMAEMKRLRADPQRVLDDFTAGDRIVVTKYLSLNDRTKFERIAGLCLARQGGDRLSASFLMRSYKLGEDYELRFPLWSPFIARVDVAEKHERNFRQKMYYLRDGPRSNWETKMPVVPKPTVAPMSIDRVAKESQGSTIVLTHQPMKKQQKLKKGGGIGAELAAAGGDKKGGGSAAKGPPPAKNAKK